MISKAMPNPTAVPPPGTAVEAVLDRAAIDVLYDDLGAEIVNEILLTAVADIERHGTKLLSLTDAEPDPVKRAAHALAGVGAAVGAIELTALARQIERACAIDGDRLAMRAALQRTAEQLRTVVAARS
jgi:HPt (histidine-containing phosphotransfer) domain-containing protein